jgi:Na+-driven multidrug efflux pump
VLVLALVATPLAGLWFGGVSGLAPELAHLATGAAVFGVLWPFSQALQSWFQGSLTFARRTRFVTEAMVVFFVVVTGVLAFGVRHAEWHGAPCAVLALTSASLCQTAWLAWRFRAAHAAES